MKCENDSWSPLLIITATDCENLSCFPQRTFPSFILDNFSNAKSIASTETTNGSDLLRYVQVSFYLTFHWPTCRYSTLISEAAHIPLPNLHSQMRLRPLNDFRYEFFFGPLKIRINKMDAAPELSWFHFLVLTFRYSNCMLILSVIFFFSGG